MAASQASPIRPVAPGAAAGIPRVIESQAHIPLVTAAPLPAGVESTPGTAQFTPARRRRARRRPRRCLWTPTRASSRPRSASASAA